MLSGWRKVSPRVGADSRDPDACVRLLRRSAEATKDTKNSMMVGCEPTNHLLFFVSFVLFVSFV
jgi:hypothetical protein